MTESTQTKIPTMSIPLAHSRGPYILGLDVGSTASRGGLYDASGCPIKGSKQRISHEFTTAADGTSEIDADQVVRECREVVQNIVTFALDHDLEISGVAMDSFASSLILVNDAGLALTPAYTYADSRSAPYVDSLRETVDEKAYHARTGVRLHTSYHPARLLWAQKEMPDMWAKTTSVMTIGEYVYLGLAGIRGLATSTAAWSGIIDVHTGELDTEILDAVGAPAELFAPLHDPDQPAYPEGTAWPQLDNKPWLHAIPDGWPSNVGPGAVDNTTVAVAAATSGAMRVILPECPTHVPEGLWCYRLSRDKWIVGGALNDVGRAVSWLERVLVGVDTRDVADALAASPTDDTPAVLPFFSGERATGWASDARASIVGLTDDTTALDLWRGVVEALAYSYKRVWDEMADTAAEPERVIASGRVTTDHPNWLKVLADALGTPVIPLEMKRATLRGTALIALDVIDPGGERAQPPFGAMHQPREEHGEYYAGLGKRFERLYGQLVTPAGE